MSENHALDTLIKARDEKVEEISELNARLREAKAALKDFDNAIESLGGGDLIEKSPIKRNYGGPTLKELVIAMLPSSGSGTTPKDIAETLTIAGRETNNTTVSATLSRLSNDEGIAEKRGGRWFLAKTNHGVVQESSLDDKKGEVAASPLNINQTPSEGLIRTGGVYGTNPSD